MNNTLLTPGAAPFGLAENAEASRGTLRLAVLCDLPEENWPSMDLVAEMLLAQLHAAHAPEVQATRIRPRMRRRLSVLPFVGKRQACFNADRLLNRLWDYPRQLRGRTGDFDRFHIADHSYAQLVHHLPAERTGVFCHDLDAFRCLLEPRREPRPRWFRRMMRHVLRGLERAAVVFHSTAEVRRRIEHWGLLDPARLVQAPYGTSPEYVPEPPGDEELTTPVPGRTGRPFLLHVGSCIARKRIDVLIDLLAAARALWPELVLVQIGGQWTAAQQAQIDRLGVGEAVIQQGGLDRRNLAMLYRRAALVVQPSDAEGFGLPVIEALACGGIVVASDIPVLREVGGPAAVYCPVGDVPRWAETVCRLLGDPAAAPDRATRLAQAQRFSWASHARTILEAYQRLE
ncbi:MAG TPA: glycosyltransferase family 1 protein [Gemmataceae bacterium]|jgi:glycosyltransferase involved in cell wall biosynthesis|nr:glycosyltransferase family 1 protein [Gemmataceae bacterium]